MSRIYGRVVYQERVWSGVIEGEEVALFEEDWWIEEGHIQHRVKVHDVVFLPPVNPHTILCVGRNYQDHAAELGNAVPKEPLFFLKQYGALTGHRQPVYRPTWVGRVDFEGELVLVIGKTVRDVTSSGDAMGAIRGMTIGNDITARELQKSDGQWTRAKGFDTFAPLGPGVLLDNHPEDRKITTRVNGTIRQDGSTNDLIFPCDQLIMEASRFMTLYPGDVIYTGTPAGIGPVDDGDIVEIAVQGIGTLSNSIKNRD